MGTFTNEENAIQRESPIIFVVTGTQEPFDRLVKILDEWAQSQTKYKIIGQLAKNLYKPKAIEAFGFIEPSKFTDIFQKAEIIIGHAGMGTIIKALENEKKLIIFPRLAKYKEHRNDHQLATAKSFNEIESIHVAFSEEELILFLNQIETLTTPKKIDTKAQPELIKAISDFIEES